MLPPGPEVSRNIHIAPDSGLRYRNVPSANTANPSPSPFLGPNTLDTLRTNRVHITTNANFQSPDQSANLPPTTGLNGSPAQPPFPAGAGHASGEDATEQALEMLTRIVDELVAEEVANAANMPAGDPLREPLEQHRRRAEDLNRIADRVGALTNSHTTRTPIQGANVSVIGNNGQFPRPPPASHSTIISGTTTQTPVVNPFNNLPSFPNNGVSQSLLLARITSRILLLELEVERGIAPSIDSIAAVRSQLYAIYDARYRQPTTTGTGMEVEGLLWRLRHVNTRAYQIRQSEYLRSVASLNPNRAETTATVNQSPEYYIITTPSGEQMTLTPPSPSLPQNIPPETIPVFPDAPRPNEHNAVGVVPDNVMHNVVREAILNQQPAAAAANGNGNGNQFAQTLRRFWLFMRLYFFCFLFTDSGTWERFFFVGAAAIISMLSDSDITSRLFNMIVQPIQRHLEGLIHGEAPAPAQGNANVNNGPNNTNTSNQADQGRAPPGGAQQQQGLRRIERALALFIASLIPGLGERQVEVRNAAEEAARNARQQEQARIEAANAQNHAEGQGQGTGTGSAAGDANNMHPQQQQQQQ